MLMYDGLRFTEVVLVFSFYLFFISLLFLLLYYSGVVFFCFLACRQQSETNAFYSRNAEIIMAFEILVVLVVMHLTSLCRCHIVSNAEVTHVTRGVQ